MLKVLFWGALSLIGIFTIGLYTAGQVRLLTGKRPTDIGLKNGLLKPPGEFSQNVVSSQAQLHPHKDIHLIEPLHFNGDAQDFFRRLHKVIQETKGATIITSDSDYIYAEFETDLLKFVDDVEFKLDATNKIVDMRSGSRIGRKDFGANRTRLERVRAKIGENSAN